MAWPALAAEKPIVLVAGATGETGALVVEVLNTKGFALRGLVRDAAKAQERLGKVGQWITGDVRNPVSLEAAFQGVTYVVSTIGSRERQGPNSFELVDWEGNRNLIDAAKAAGVKRFVMMTSGSAGPAKFDDPDVQRFGAGRIWKFKAEEYLRDSDLPYVVVAPGGLRNFASGTKGLRLRARNQYSVGVVSRGDVAALIVECITNEACLSKTITVVNDESLKPASWIDTLTVLPMDTAETVRTSSTSNQERSP